MEKYLAKTDYCTLGSVHETKEQAEKQATAYRDWHDEVTGYYMAVGKHSHEPSPVIPIEDQCPTTYEFVAAMAEYEEESRKLDEEIRQLKEKRLGKYWDMTRRYVNLGTIYNHHDLIEVTYLRKGSKFNVQGIVYDVWITEHGEIRPKIGNYYDRPKDEIESVMVLKRREEMTASEIFGILHKRH